MSDADIQKIISELEASIDSENASLVFLNLDVGDYLVQANKDGLQLFAKELLRASLVEAGQGCPIDDGTKDEVYSDISISYVRHIEKIPEIVVTTKTGGRDLTLPVFLIIFIFILSIFGLGLATLIRWFL